MRIIAGKFRGRKLNEFNVESTRPTLDRIKEPLFSILMPHLENAQVLDLFSGTANLALEAISRGARFAWINDINRQALKVIIGNVRLTGTDNCVKITGKDYAKCLKQIHTEGIKFDVIFLDPPYACDYEAKVLNLIVEYDILNKDGIIVLESDKRKTLNEDIPGLNLKDERTYGRVIIRLYKLEE
jgi:16S rRNA (guanine(966)-N(2))-methyltransferase RsmD